MSISQPRREFLGNVGKGTAGLITAGYTATALGYSANETVSVGCVGTGGRCRRLMQSLAKIPGVKITAVCDVWDHHREMGKKLADPKATSFKDYRRLLQRSDIDAVLIGTPDHWHVPITIDACAAGKDVYVEKPLTHELAEGEKVVAAQNRHKRIVQVGMQQRSMPQMEAGYKIVQSGEIGKVHKVHLTWNRNVNRGARKKLGIDPKTVDWKMFLGNAPDQPFDEYRFRNWRWFWDFGGGIFTDLMVHFVDVAHWYLGLELAETATSIGNTYMPDSIWETPDTVQTLLQFPQQQTQVYFEGTFVNARNGAMLEFMGQKATLYLDRGRYEVHPERHQRIKYRDMVLGTGNRGADFYDKPDGETLHLANWIECIRSRKRPNAPAEAGVAAASSAHLANKAMRSGRVVRPNA